MNKILPIPAFKDNYIWAIINSNRNTMAVVDPGDAAPVLHFMKENKLSLTDILITHHHWDHTGGVKKLLKINENIPCFGPDNISGVNNVVKENDYVVLKNYSLKFKVLEIPGHTLDHIAYFNDNILFCGDTLFSAGCGRTFEGTASQMLNSLNKLKALPDETLVYPAHEYTESNILFALTIDPNNQDLNKYKSICKNLRQQNIPSLPTNIKLEKQINPFLRCNNKHIQQMVEQYTNKNINDTVEVFSNLRAWKDIF
jgi:hydroxyacylglutathione hydrolase